MDDYNFYNSNDFQNNQPEPNPVYQPPRQEKPKARFSLLTVIVAAVLAGFVGMASATITTAYFWNQDKNQVTDHLDLENNTVNINVEEQAISVVEAVAKKVTPCVVGIRTTTSVNSFFGNQQEESGEGSGVIYKQNGYIITNYHVIEDAVTNARNTKIEVFLDSSADNSYIATVVGYNISADLAVIKINVTGLPAIEIADSDKVKVGQYVITVGNPGGLEFMDSVTYGVISGLNRVVSSDGDIGLIQTDAAINPGNSGGALVDVTGKLVGINSSKIVSEEFEGMGFAIPSNEAVEICDKIIAKENSPEPYIGITISEKYTKEVLEFYGYPTGAVVLSVYNGSPAYQAGLRKGDIITEFANTEITEYTVLEKLISNCKPNQKVSVKLYRSGRYYSTTITVGSNNAIG
ncbi:MAG: trypsin-like peptidase domain-containing protein [Clostridia bacterium]|nr:trypsin-like peptidase domain-containing protein [Clostridia bacterium]